mgnify:CR=1 FL=1
MAEVNIFEHISIFKLMKTKALLIAAVGFFVLSGVTRHDMDEAEYLAPG